MTSGENSKIAIIGAGYMGGGMAQVFALNGHKVSIFDIDAKTTRRSFDRLISESQTFEELGLFAPGSAEIIGANLGYAESVEEAVKEANYIAEVVPEVIEIKKDVFERIGAAPKLDAIIA